MGGRASRVSWYCEKAKVIKTDIRVIFCNVICVDDVSFLV